jgi:hypothetical protein
MRRVDSQCSASQKKTEIQRRRRRLSSVVTVLPERLAWLGADGSLMENRQNLVLGQKSLIFALQLACADVSFAPVLQPQGVLMVDGADRREARRFTMSLPMRVLPRESKGYELDAHTRDVSYRGLYFVANANFEIGTEIEFVITLPQQVTQSGDVNIRCLGEVVRIEPTENGRVGIAAKIARYEFMPATATAA